MENGFKFSGIGKLDRVERFVSKNNKTIITLIFRQEGQYEQLIPIKCFGRLAEMASGCKPGDILEVTGNLGGRDFNGKVYGDISARTVEVVSQGAQAEKQNSGQQSDGLTLEDGSEIPF